MLLKKKEREAAEIPSSSLADIAFLLLIFFLVTTTIDVDTGIGLVLPPPPDPTVPPPPIKEKNMLKLLVNSQGLILVNEKPAALAEVKELVIGFIDNKGTDPTLSDSPDKAIISLKTDKQTPYRIYIDVLDEVKGAYADLRDKASMARFGVKFDKLGEGPQKEVKEMYPQKISEAEPDKGN
ncbi:biopolymer transporter ExbD [bacterium]|nr:MAG: biopolymer transporter ExbD [bacterium]